MANKILVEYARNGLRKGISTNRLKEEMLKKGYPAREIEEAMNKAYSEIGVKGFSFLKQKVFAISFLIILILLIAAVSMIIINKKIKVVEIPVPFEKVVATDAENLRFHLLNDDIRWVATAVSCEAVVADDTGKCNIINNTISRQWCVDDFEDYNEIIFDNINSYLKVGCEKFREKPEIRGVYDEEVCKKVKQGSCDNLDGKKLAVCKAFIEDPSACLEFAISEKCEKYFIRLQAIYFSNAELCENKNVGIAEIEVCKHIVLGNCTGLLDSLIYDLSIIDYTKRQQDLSTCEKVSNEELRNLCFKKELTYMDIYNQLKPVE